MPDSNDRLCIAGLRVDAFASLADLTPRLRDALRSARERPWIMTFVNPASVSVARRNPVFANMLAEFDAVAPDGIGVVLAARIACRRRIARISFDTTSLAPVVFRLAQEHAATIALVGGRPGIAEVAAANLRTEYADLQIAGTFDGYADQAATIQKVMRLNPTIVICGMGAPAQEAFILALWDSGWTGIGLTCGGYLDQLVDGPQYYPSWVDRSNLRWVYRLVREPRRLWRRYLLEYPVYAGRVAQDLFLPPRGDDPR